MMDEVAHLHVSARLITAPLCAIRPATCHNSAEYTFYSRPNYAAARMDVLMADGMARAIWEKDAGNYW